MASTGNSTPLHSRPTSPASRLKPRILCLHGGGTSALIFKIQLRNFCRSLSPTFNFIFLDAPFISDAGPGVLPVFEDCKPYHRWMPVEDYGSRGLEAGVKEQENAARRSREKMLEAIEKDTKAGHTGPVVGVAGFSQGGRMTAGLLADQHEGKTFPELPIFKFGVLLCASYPPYSLTNASKTPLDWPGPRDHHGTLKPPTEAEIISIPTVHVRGLLDPHLEKGRRVSKYFDGEEGVKEELEFQMYHNMPQAAGDTTSGGQESTNKIRDAVMKVWHNVEGH